MKRWITKLAALIADSRRHPRVPTDLQVSLSGPLGAAAAQSTDLNKRGAAVRTVEAVEPGTLVFLRIHSLQLAGFANVRHCRPITNGYSVGLEFREGLTRERTEESNWGWSRVTPQLAWDEAEA